MKENAPPASVAMLGELGHALLDLTKALTPDQPAARRRMRRQLQQALRRTPSDQPMRRDLLRLALQEMRR